jgi:type VI secretion system secreted protein Hcp
MYQNACAGTPFQYVYLGLRKSSGGGLASTADIAGQFFVLFTFGLVAVKTISWAHDDESPQETITFEFGAMQIQYAQQLQNGTLDAAKVAAWNRLTNTATMPAAS